MFGLPLQARRAQARLMFEMSQLQDDGGESAAAVAPTLDEQLQAAYVRALDRLQRVRAPSVRAIYVLKI